jgi:hypothetical protein
VRLYFRFQCCFCGCPADAIIEYDSYLDARRHANWKQPESSYAFWMKSMGQYPMLALKSLNFPLSSISAERTTLICRAAVCGPG